MVFNMGDYIIAVNTHNTIFVTIRRFFQEVRKSVKYFQR